MAALRKTQPKVTNLNLFCYVFCGIGQDNMPLLESVNIC